MNTHKCSAVISQNYQYVFTVFTPTYNRAHTLSRVYNSLKTQTYRDFEWLIIDDGSIDNTCNLIEQWQKEAEFPIRYIRQENQGKHIAFNRGVKQAKGELFLTFDSDDACVPEALERFKYHWDSIPEKDKAEFSAVTTLCINQDGKLVGNAFPFDILDSNTIELHTKYQVIGEKWGFQKTDIFKEFPFPEIESEKFITEGIIWNRISLKYKTRFVNEKLRIYYEDMNDSLTKYSIKVRARNPRGARLYYQEYLKLPISVKWKLKDIVNYIRFSFHGKVSPQQIILESEYQFFTALLLMIGYLFYQKDIYTIFKHLS